MTPFFHEDLPTADLASADLSPADPTAPQITVDLHARPPHEQHIVRVGGSAAEVELIELDHRFFDDTSDLGPPPTP